MTSFELNPLEIVSLRSIYTYYGPEERKFSNLTHRFLTEDIDKVMPALGLPDEPIPLWWTCDFILASPEGTPSAEEKWIIGEFNCSCVGAPFPRALHSRSEFLMPRRTICCVDK